MPRHAPLAMPVDSTPTESQALPRGAVVGDFRIQQLTRREHWGFVYLASDLFMQRDVALNEYFPSHMAQRKPDGGLQVFLTEAETFSTSKGLFMMEAIQLSRMNHAAVAKVNRVWESGGTAYVTMPLYQGRMLDEVCAFGEIVPTVSWVEQFVRPLLDFISSLHRRSIHGVELSVSNVMLLENRYPLIMSLGPRFSGQALLGNTSAVPPQPWSDVQALARMMLEIMGPAVGKVQYPQAWISSLQDAAAGVPGRRAANVFELMQFCGLADRRSRPRVAGESALVETGRDTGPGRLNTLDYQAQASWQPTLEASVMPTFNNPAGATTSELSPWVSTTFTAFHSDHPEEASPHSDATLAPESRDTPMTWPESDNVLQLPNRRASFDDLNAAKRRSAAVVATEIQESLSLDAAQSSGKGHATEPPLLRSVAEAPDALAVSAIPASTQRRDAPPAFRPSSPPMPVVSRKRPATLVAWIRNNWATLAFALVVALLVANLVATLTS
jgi:hypothetical protein